MSVWDTRHLVRYWSVLCITAEGELEFGVRQLNLARVVPR